MKNLNKNWGVFSKNDFQYLRKEVNQKTLFQVEITLKNRKRRDKNE